MSINPLKEFFKRRKAEVKFARAGPGKRLNDEPSTSSSSSSADHSSARKAAADAAMKRFNLDNTAQPKRIAPLDRPKTQQDPRTAASTKSEAKASDAASSSKSAVADQIELPVIDGVPQRDIRIFTLDELAQKMKQPEIDDDFFRLTVDDVKLYKQRFDEERARNEILRTSEMRRREAEAKKPTTNIARLRFKLPNNFVLEASFSGSETLRTVSQWLRDTCRDKMELNLQNFDLLFGFKPFKESDFDSSVKQLGLIPATTITLVIKN